MWAQSIRNLAVGLPRRDGQLLVSLYRDRSKQQDFCRAIGGGIEFGETAQQALRREFREELGVELTAELKILDTQEPAHWIPVETFRSGELPLYPAGCLELLDELPPGWAS